MAEERTDSPDATTDDPWGEIAELKKEQQLGGTPAGQAANAALLALSRAARSFLLYDPSNHAIRTFLDDLKNKCEEFSNQYGALALDIRPFELVYEGDIVYLERDRDRSLAFKMFRDGVRRITIQADVTWDELLRLLEILSIRYTGVRQQEDDIVTLLWKAGFKHIEIEAVEGVMPDEEEDGDGGPQEGGSNARVSYGAQIEAPADRDQPLPGFYRAGRLRYAELDAHEIEGLRGEVDARHLAQNALALADAMMAVVKDPTDPTELNDILSYIDEVRDFLLAEEQLGHLSRLVMLLQRSFPDEPELITPMLNRFSGPEALSRILKSIQKNHTSPPPELLQLMALLPADHLDQCIDILGMARDQASRRIVRQLIEHFIEGREVWFMGRMLGVDDPAVAADLLRCAAKTMPETVYDFSPELADKAGQEVLQELLRHIETITDHPEVDKALLALLEHDSESVRIRSIEALAAHGDGRAYLPLVESVQNKSFKKLSAREAEAIGQAMARIQPNQARNLFEDWVKPKKMMHRMFGRPGQKMLAWTALAGFEVIVDEEYDSAIEWLAKRTSDDLYKRCRGCLVHRRRTRRLEEEGA
jgi:hypothetical protein